MTFEILDWKDNRQRTYKIVRGDDPTIKPVKLYAVLLTYNFQDYLPYCLEALMKQIPLENIFVNDNMSTDNTMEILRGFGVNTIGTRKKGDLSYNMNKLLNTCVPKDGWVFYLNPDEILFDLPEGYLARYCAFLEQNGFTASDVRFPDFIYNYRTLFAEWDWGEGPGVYWTSRRLFKFTGKELFKGATHYNVVNTKYDQEENKISMKVLSEDPLHNWGNEHFPCWYGKVAKTDMIRLFHYGKLRGIENQRGKSNRLANGDKVAKGLICTKPYDGQHPSVMGL